MLIWLSRLPGDGGLMAAQWEYRVSWADDDTSKVNTLMAQYAEAGWELVNGSTTVYRVGDSLTKGLHYRYSMYWRREINR
jgi:hypothetical protein